MLSRSGQRSRPGHVKTKSLSELHWLPDETASKAERHKFGSADNLVGAGTDAGGGAERPSTGGDLRRFGGGGGGGLEMSNSASLDRLAVYDQPSRKLSVGTSRPPAALADLPTDAAVSCTCSTHIQRGS